jgi:predicted nucleic acid-binding protein
MQDTNPLDHPHYEAIRTVAAAVLSSEKQLDDCILSALVLMSTTISTVEKEGLPRQSVQPAIDRIEAAVESLLTTRREIIATHQEYGKLAHGLGASPEAFGDFWPCPTGALKPKRRRLEVAA